MKAIMISIKPKYVADILNGKKTIEIRKTMPKCDLPIDVYIYCSKGNKKNWHLIEVVDTDTGWEGYEYDYYIGSKGYLDHCLEGKVVAKFTLKEIYLAKYQKHKDDKSKRANKLTCLTDEELDKYLNCKDGYGWKIDNLVIFDKPKELWEFKTPKNYDRYQKALHQAYEDDEEIMTRLYEGYALDNECANCVELTELIEYTYGLQKSPESWCYVEVRE